MSPHPVGFLRRALIPLAAITLFVTAPLHAATAPSSKVQFRIPAGDARPMLRQFAAQAKREIIFAVDGVDGVTTNAVDGELTYGEALSRMLLDTGLIASTDAKTGAIAIRKETDAEKNASRAVPTSDRPESNGETQYAEKKVELPVFEVMAGKVLNMDIRRIPDNASCEF